MESRLLPNIIWEQEVKSKKSGKKSFLQKLIYLANAFQNPIQILLLDKLTVWNIRDITFLEFASSRIWENSFNQIKQFRHLTDIILIPQNFKSTRDHQIFRIFGPCDSNENIFLQCPSQNFLFCLKEGCRYSFESRRKALGQRVVFRDKRGSFW